MRAIIVQHPGAIDKRPLVMAERPMPVPRENELLVRVHYCGACHTDLHIAEGDLKLKTPSIIPGHQAIGQVEVVGQGVTGLKKGDTVGTTWLASACGTCPHCSDGRENLCEQARFTGYDTDGGYADYMTVKADFAVTIPDEFCRPETAPFLCAGVIGYRSLKLCAVKPGENLGLYGFGASAHIAIQIARYWDCKVYVFTREPDHREHALSLGAVWAGAIEDEAPAKMNGSITFAPVGHIVPAALKGLDRGGTLAINAVHMTDIPAIPYQLLYHERTVRSVANLTRADARETLDLARKVPLHADVEVYPLEEANDVLLKIKNSQIKGAAVLKII